VNVSTELPEPDRRWNRTLLAWTGSRAPESSNMRKVHIAGTDGPATLYSVDVILAVGYRANPSRVMAFRRWASTALKQCLIEGDAHRRRSPVGDC